MKIINRVSVDCFLLLSNSQNKNKLEKIGKKLHALFVSCEIHTRISSDKFLIDIYYRQYAVKINPINRLESSTPAMA